MIGADSSPTHFSVKIRCHFHQGLEIEKIFPGGISSSSSDSASSSWGGWRVSVGPVQAACWRCWLCRAVTRAACGEEAGSGLGHAKIEKGEGKEEASWAGLRFQLGFSLLPNRNSENPFLFQIFFIICKLI
jgi:hypothetical protein